MSEGDELGAGCKDEGTCVWASTGSPDLLSFLLLPAHASVLQSSFLVWKAHDLPLCPPLVPPSPSVTKLSPWSPPSSSLIAKLVPTSEPLPVTLPAKTFAWLIPSHPSRSQFRNQTLPTQKDFLISFPFSSFPTSTLMTCRELRAIRNHHFFPY